MPEREAVDYGAAPVVPQKDDTWRVQVFGEQRHVVGGALEGVVF